MIDEILKGNRIIAFFDSTIKDYPESNSFYLPQHSKDDFEDWVHEKDLKYHLSWDWLMPVIEKIEYLYATDGILPRFEINSHICSFSVGYPEFKKHKQWICGCYKDSPEKEKQNTKIEAAYYVCVEFIKWYNSLNK